VTVALEEKYDQVRQLIAMGKERGYLLYDEVNDILPPEVHSSEEIDDLLSTFERYGIDVYEDLASAKAALAAADATDSAEPIKETDAIASEDGDLDLTPGSLEKTNDPVRMYLREMGTVPLLTREGEVAIAKRIERGQLLVLKTITRAPLILKELLQVGEDLRNGSRSIKEIVQFDDEELTEEKIEAKTKDTLKQIDKVAKLYLLALKQAGKLSKMAKSKKRPYLRARYALARTRVEMSNRMRDLDFNPLEKKRLIEKIRQTVERVHFLEREIVKLERRVEASKADVQAEARKDLKARRQELAEIELASEVSPTELKRGLQVILRGEAEAEQAKKRINRGQPSSRRFHREEIYQPRSAVPRPDSGRQHRPDESRGQIRMAPGLQVFHLRHLVDSPSHHARHRRPGPHHPHSGAHDRNDQQTRPHPAAVGAGARPRAYFRRNRQAHGHSCREGTQDFENCAGADFARNSHRRGRRFASRRFHRGQGRRLALRRGHQSQPEGANFFGAENPHSARGKSHQDAFRS